jgi:hypothetical protein
VPRTLKLSFQIQIIKNLKKETAPKSEEKIPSPQKFGTRVGEK